MEQYTKFCYSCDLQAPVVSTYVLGKEPNPENITIKDIIDLTHAFGPQAYGSRKVTFVEGCNIYGGHRSLSNAAVASPVEGKSATGKNDFYRQQYLLEETSVCTKLINNIVFQGTLVPLTCEYLVCNFLQPEHLSEADGINLKNTFCRTKIVTFGNNRTIGFFNSLHTDDSDGLPDEGNHFIEYLELCKTLYIGNDTVLDAVAYLLQWLKSEKIGTPTTCVYQFIGSENLFDDDEIYL